MVADMIKNGQIVPSHVGAAACWGSRARCVVVHSVQRSVPANRLATALWSSGGVDPAMQAAGQLSDPPCEPALLPCPPAHRHSCARRRRR